MRVSELLKKARGDPYIMVLAINDDKTVIDSIRTPETILREAMVIERAKRDIDRIVERARKRLAGRVLG